MTRRNCIRQSRDWPGSAAAVAAELSRSDQARRVVEECIERFGRLDVLVNAHGILGTMKPLTELTDEDLLSADQSSPESLEIAHCPASALCTRCGRPRASLNVAGSPVLFV
nr:SDR family NAD(P)-dependent oxidoreductase [Rhodococcus qingshengii]